VIVHIDLDETGVPDWFDADRFQERLNRIGRSGQLRIPLDQVQGGNNPLNHWSASNDLDLRLKELVRVRVTRRNFLEVHYSGGFALDQSLGRRPVNRALKKGASRHRGHHDHEAGRDEERVLSEDTDVLAKVKAPRGFTWTGQRCTSGH
jgi:hypothetical protein